jgi:hypothetical protein
MGFPSAAFEPNCSTSRTLTNTPVGPEQQPPISISFKLRKDLSSGEHPIYLSFTYHEDNETYMSYQMVNIKIRAWYERQWAQVTLIVAAMASILALLFSVNSDSYIVTLLRKKNHHDQDDANNNNENRKNQ